MLVRDLTKVYISEYEEIEDHGETEKVWKFKPQYKVIDKNKIGSTYLYICEKVQE